MSEYTPGAHVVRQVYAQALAPASESGRDFRRAEFDHWLDEREVAVKVATLRAIAATFRDDYADTQFFGSDVAFVIEAVADQEATNV